MSHFTVLVIGDDVEGQLAPFQENNMGDCPQEYMEFFDKEEEYKDDYETDTTEMYFDPSSGAFYDIPTDEVVKEDYEKKGYVLQDVPVKSVRTFDDYMEEIGYSKDKKTGKFGYWENPNKKWDWYQLGGRWSGLLRVKPGKEGAKGSPGLMGSHHSDDDLAVDQCLKGDLDHEGMAEVQRQRRIGWWESSERRYLDQGGLEGMTFEECLKQYGDSLNRLRKEWEAMDKESRGPFHQHVQRDSEFHEAHQALDWDARDFFNEPWPENPTKEMYINKGPKIPFSTYAVVKDGKWFEKGEMGWWGMSTNEMSDADWEQEFSKLVDDLPDDTLLSVVDCHI